MFVSAVDCTNLQQQHCRNSSSEDVCQRKRQPNEGLEHALLIPALSFWPVAPTVLQPTESVLMQMKDANSDETTSANSNNQRK
eukprot:CAMPEP_0174733266 /NCGR_PEP_ID=MMETSP1094-20130205/60950_1 /TAXON_ID=156173 /ORGANISM="Chrysochromulina brevifilum, Strain UTEX LB 985" /LENGTH=82 /DNA_ID=CAMNT_0015935899 /DNA_START=630 /DNA_END=878 /DNA_ORIENTATION=-